MYFAKEKGALVDEKEERRNKIKLEKLYKHLQEERERNREIVFTEEEINIKRNKYLKTFYETVSGKNDEEEEDE